MIVAYTISFGWHVGWALSTGDFIQLDEGHIVFGRTYCSPGMTLTGPTPITARSFVRDFRANQRFACSFPSPDGRWHVQVPVWSILLAVGVPTLFTWKPLRLRRRKPGHCIACGYDLAGNTTGICPECGGAAGGQEQPAAN